MGTIVEGFRYNTFEDERFIVSENLKERAYAHIVDRMAHGALPPGSRLSNRRLAGELGVSVIPVREAISRLESEGFVEYQPGVGAFVPSPSYDELLEIYDLREAIECHAIRKVAESITEADLDRLDDDLASMAEVADLLQKTDRKARRPEWFEQWTSADADFHDLFLRVAGNRRALQTVQNLRQMSRIFGTKVAGKPLAELVRSIEEHRRILEALKRGDPDRASRAMAEHIQSGCRVLLQAHHRDRLDSMPS